MNIDGHVFIRDAVHPELSCIKCSKRWADCETVYMPAEFILQLRRLICPAQSKSANP